MTTLFKIFAFSWLLFLFAIAPIWADNVLLQQDPPKDQQSDEELYKEDPDLVTEVLDVKLKDGEQKINNYISKPEKMSSKRPKIIALAPAEGS
ncbi:MAG: hypothetical protein HY606_01780, partial [Planctomycetes bacterium]|nr:hypothetical protein [Planctomycetota bacterium]